MIYLDHAATTPLRPEVAEEMARISASAFANPSSLHSAGRRAKAVLEDARERILRTLGSRAAGVDRDFLVFTSGATEANRLGLLGMARGAVAAGRTPGVVRRSSRDHGSLVAAADELRSLGFRAVELPLAASGLPTLESDALPAVGGSCDSADRPCNIVTTTIVCGQTGTLDDLGRMRAIFPTSFIHADATQAAAWLAGCGVGESFAESGVSTLALAPHKFGGPRGIGGLVVRAGTPLAPVVAGPQESGLRGGTEPVALAAGFAVALERCAAERAAETARILELRDRFERGVVAAARAGGIEAVPVAGEMARAPHISTISFPGLDRQAIVMAADLAGISCSTGSACSSGSAEPSPVLVAMGLSREVVRGAVRFSFGRPNTVREVDDAIASLGRIVAANAGAARLRQE